MSDDDFTEQDLAHRVAIMKGVHAITTVWNVYTWAPFGSPAESAASDQFESMLDTLRNKPDHTDALIGGLCALIEHLRGGGTYEEFFAEALGERTEG